MAKEIVCGTHRSYEKGCRCESCVFFIREYHAKWRSKNTEKKRESANSWSKKNKEKVLEYSKKYYYENLKTERLRNKAYRSLHPEAGASRARRRRAREKNVEVSPYTEKQILSLYGVNCHLCYEKINLNASRWIGRGDWEYGLHIDHVVPISKGGGDTLQNVRPSHGICNIKKGDRVNV